MDIQVLDNLAVKISIGKGSIILEANMNYQQALLITHSKGADYLENSNKCVTWPGEYELSGVYVKGIESDDGATIFEVQVEGVNIVHSGQASVIKSETLDSLGNVDILILPMSDDSLDLDKAKNLVNALEPRVIIPVGPNKQSFLSENATDSLEQISKYTISKTKLPAENTEIICLEKMV